MNAREARFTRIYRGNRWSGQDTKAGPGSSPEATEHLRRVLPVMCEELMIRSVLDAGCNEGTWVPDLPGYIGMDIVPQAISKAKSLHNGRRYILGDFVTDRLPVVDAILCRDALQHLSIQDVLDALGNFHRSGAKFLIANSHRGGENKDIPSGLWFPIDLEAPPFEMGAPMMETHDGLWPSGVRYPNKVLGVWRL